MIHLGLTGGIACGKSLASQWFETHEVPLIDSDVINRDLLAHDSSIHTAIHASFGDEVFTVDQAIDRAALRAIIFSDADARTELETILHPAIKKVIQSWLESQKSSPNQVYCVVVVPLLFESGFDSLVEQSCVIDCSHTIQRQRLMSRDNLNPLESQAILDAQMPREQRLLRADWVISNDQSAANMNQQLEELHLRLNSLTDSR